MVMPFVMGSRICGAGKAKCSDCNDGDAEIFQDHFSVPPTVFVQGQSWLEIKVPMLVMLSISAILPSGVQSALIY
jgi:hypothetical protein